MQNLNISDLEVKINNFGENFAVGLRQTFVLNGLNDYFSIPTDGYAQRSQRPADGPSALVPGILSEHNAIAAKINALMQIQDNGFGTTIRAPFDTGNLPYYSVKFIRTQGIVPYTDWDFLQDVMELTYGMEFSIRPTAWNPILIVTLVGATVRLYTGAVMTVTATTAPITGIPVDITYNGSATAPSARGTYAVLGTVNSFDYEGIGTGTMVISLFVDTWTSRTQAVNSAWDAIAWSPSLGLFAAVSSSGLVMTSPEGTNWTARTAASANQWNAVAWSPSLALFVAVGSGTGPGYVMTSPDGITWTTRTQATALNAVAWGPTANTTGMFVAVNSIGSGNGIFSSPDGITWTGRGNAGSWRSVAWSPALGLFVALPFGVGTAVVTSPDGITWTSHAAAVTAQQWTSIAWSPTLALFVAVSASGTNRVATSPDGIVWTPRTAAEANAWNGVAWCTALGYFVAVASSGTNRVMISSDGITWTAIAASAASSWKAVAWSPELGLAASVAASSTVEVMTSLPYLP